MSLALEYVRAGWAIVPIPAKLKGPQGNDWNRIDRCIRTEEEASKLTENIGLAHAYSGTCVVDVDNYIEAKKWLADHGIDLDELFNAPNAVRISSGRPNRGKLLYKWPAGLPPLPQKQVAGRALDFRCGTSNGKTVQDVLPPSIHPDTGKPYVWEYPEPMVGDWHYPPELPAAVLTVWKQLIGAHTAIEDDEVESLMREPVLGLSDEQIRELLSDHDPDAPYDSDDLREGSWLKVGMALHHECNGQRRGLDLWDEWSSASADKYKGREDLAKRWKGFGRSSGRLVTARWLRKVTALRKAPECPLLDPKAPMSIARELVARKYDRAEGRILQRVDDLWYEHIGSHYLERPEGALRAAVWNFLDSARKHNKDGDLEPFRPGIQHVSGVLDALKAVTHVTPERAPCWLPGYTAPPPGDVIALKNGLFHVQSGKLMPHTPGFFTLNALPFDWQPNGLEPVNWLRFLNDLWGDDVESINTLQEMFGYLLTPDTSQQKMFLIVGAKRSGKGTIGRVLAALLGSDNIANPTLSSLTSNFGLQPLIGKLAAVCSDARLSGKADSQAIVERLLMVSGEDGVTIDRKNRTAWTGKLSSRFVLLTNELPNLGDASGALAGRFIILETVRSFYGKEDLNLTNRLLEELPGIFKWALAGRARLALRGSFLQPSSARDAVEDLEELSSPVRAFVEDKCVVGVGKQVACAELYSEWREWCSVNGRDNAGTLQNFARYLRAAFPTVWTSREMVKGERKRYFEEISLKPEPGFAQ